MKATAKYNKEGQEVMDPTPLAVPVGFKKPLSLQEQIKRMIRTSISQDARDKGYESFEEASDFDIPDDPVEPDSPYEAREFEGPSLPPVNDPQPQVHEHVKNRRAELKKKLDKKDPKDPPMPAPAGKKEAIVQAPPPVEGEEDEEGV